MGEFEEGVSRGGGVGGTTDLQGALEALLLQHKAA